MRALTWCLLGGLLLAGCSGGNGSDDEPADDPCLVESAEDFACQEETEATGNDRPHLHDYWQGQESKALQPMVTDASPFLCVDEGRAALLQPQDGDTFIQGTGRIDLTISWVRNDPGLVDGTTHLWIQTAADAEPWEYGEVSNGDSFTIESDNERNDLPHQRLSAWSFILTVRPTNATGCFEWDGTTTLEATLHRTLEIPLYPGHPDQWDNETMLPILEAGREVFFYWGDGTGGTCLSSPAGGDCLWAPPFSPTEGTIVPFDTRIVRITVTETDLVGIDVGMGYHGADSREIQYPDPVSDDGTTRVYDIDVGFQGDGPYALQSLWEFWPYPMQEVAGLNGFYNGSFSVTVEAFRDVPP